MMSTEFRSSSPEAQGVPSDALLRFFTVLDSQRIPLHSALLMRHGHLICEAYTPPYTQDTLHRMFSVTKSFVSLAIGLLESEGRLHLEDRIADYFADMLGGAALHPYLSQTTIRDLLCMASPHAASAYKVLSPNGWTELDWVKSFFLCPPARRPGLSFAYDTSATHVLGVLVEQLTGMPLLDYLRGKCLNAIGFSADAYCLRDHFGHSMGGSGLMATPRDLLRVLVLLSNDGCHQGEQLLPRAYLRAATSRQMDTFARPGAHSLEETHGYGYLFWRTRGDGYACYGMGGQLAVCLPGADLQLVLTADTQDIPGGVQILYDTFFREIVGSLQVAPLPEAPAAQARLAACLHERQLPSVPVGCAAAAADVSDASFQLDENAAGFERISLTLGANSGTLAWQRNGTACRLPFGIGHNTFTRFPEGKPRCAASGAFRGGHTFVVSVQLTDTCVGSLLFSLSFAGDLLSLYIHHAEETLFQAYEGFFSGRRIRREQAADSGFGPL